MTDDIAGFQYNPSSLNTLKTSQAAFNYQKGLVDDSYGQLMFGRPARYGALGVTMGYYDGGQFNLADGTSVRSVRAKSELLISAGGARTIGPLTGGLALKFLRSTLAETATANAIAVDIGTSYDVGHSIRIGAALQNMGSALHYGDGTDHLPRVFRLGFSSPLNVGRVPLTLVMDTPYFFNEKELRPGLGLETSIGPLALRTGYKSGSDLQEFSVGAGFLMGSTSIDYSFGFAQKLEASHRISVAMRFNTSPPVPDIVLRKERTVVEMPVVSYTQKASRPMASETLGGLISTPGAYRVKSGESLEKIAKRAYGESKYWTLIYNANEEMITDPEMTDLTGQQLWLPAKPAEAK
jgi:LysM repeat protein